MSKLNFFPHNIDIKILIVIQTKLSKLIVFRELKSGLCVMR